MSKKDDQKIKPDNILDDLVTTEGAEDIFKKMFEKDEKYNQELRKKSKSKEELVVNLELLVKSVNGYINQTSFTPRSEMVLGGTSPRYGGGDKSYLEIEVYSGNKVKIIEFQGLPPIFAGDKIRAYIFKGEEKFEKESFPKHSRNNPTSHYIERDFKKIEKAFKIEKLSKNDILATYHSR